MPELVSQAAYARHQDVSQQTVGTWKKEGRLVMAGRKVDVAASDTRLAETECPGRKAGAIERKGNGVTKEAASFQASRAALQSIKVKQAQLELDKQSGVLVVRADAERQAFEDGRRFRDAMMSLPDQYKSVSAFAPITNPTGSDWGRKQLKAYLGDDSISWSGSYAYADSYTDLPLLEQVGHPVVVYPDDELAAHAQDRGWEIIG